MTIVLRAFQPLRRRFYTLWGRSALSVSRSAERKGLLPLAIRRAGQALWAFHTVNDEKRRSEALLQLADLYLQSLDWKEAKEWANLAAGSFAMQNDREGEREARFLTGTACCADGDFATGLRSFGRSLELAVLEDRKAEEADAAFMLALTAMRLGLNDDAIRHVQRSIAVSDAIGLHRRLSYAWSLLARLQLQDAQEAERCNERAIAFGRRAGNAEALYSALLQSAKMLVLCGNPERADAWITEAAGLNGFQKTAVSRQEELEALSLLHFARQDFVRAIVEMVEVVRLAQENGLMIEAARALLLLGRFYRRIGQDREAEQSWRDAILLQEQFWRGLGSDDRLKVSSGETFEAVYHELLSLLVSHRRNEEALELSEHLRAQAFAELLRGRVPGQTAEETRLSAAAIKEFASATQSTIVEYTVIVNFQGNAEASWTRSDSAIVVAIVVSPSGGVNAIPIDLETFLEEGIPLPDEVAAQTSSAPTQTYRDIAPESGAPDLAPDSPEVLAAWHRFFIAPIAQWLPTRPDQSVIFIPHVWLFSLPFPALIGDDGAALIEKFAIMTAPSVQVLALLRERRSQSASQSRTALVIGDPVMPALPSGRKLPQLLGAAEEARAIARLLKTEPLLQEQATKERVMAELPRHRVIHLATHGILSTDFALGAIALAPGSEDGYLRAEEILELPLHADLVVLSACHTGGGRILPDGVIGLSRAVLAAGASSVLVSLREIPDQHTAPLMEAFYRGYLQTGDKAAALREAMLEVRKIHANPLLWAFFTLIGDRLDAPAA